MVKNILFDLGNVLIDIDTDKTLRMFSQLVERNPQSTIHHASQDVHISAGDLIGKGESELMAKYQIGEISTDEFIDAILTICKPGTARQQVIDAWMAMLIGIPQERYKRVVELHKQGYKLYVLSNINEMHAGWTREQIKGLPFEQVFFSNEMRMAKPDVRCYEQVIRETGINAAETLYIDDIPTNIEAAKSLGFECFLNTKADEWATMCDV